MKRNKFDTNSFVCLERTKYNKSICKHFGMQVKSVHNLLKKRFLLSKSLYKKYFFCFEITTIKDNYTIVIFRRNIEP